jgi:hypothetical protein
MKKKKKKFSSGRLKIFYRIFLSKANIKKKKCEKKMYVKPSRI